jgi:serine/threonine protein kinase
MKKLGKYELRRELGRGAMGIVYEAFDPLIERTVAIKTILKSAIDKHEAEEVFRRFRREARAAGRLSHPKIVSIHEYGEDDDMAFIVMELIRGKELKEYFDHGDRFAIMDGIRIVMQLLDALDYSHACGVVHRDIKPANIMITNEGQIKIADFGIAKIDSSSLTQVGVVLGTPTYMSPEQFMGHEVDHRTDIYAAGVILYQFLTGERPFTGSVITIMHQAVHQEAVPPSQRNTDVPKQFDEVVKKAMGKRMEDRFQSATEFMAALKAAAQALPAPEHRGGDSDATLVDTYDAFITAENFALPSSANLPDSRREADIQSMKKESARARETEEQARLKQEVQERAALEEKRRKEAEQRAALERSQAQTKALAEAEARRQRDAEKKALLVRKIAEIKLEAEMAMAAEAEKRKKEAAEQERRNKELLASLSEHTKKFAEIVTEREAVTDADLRIKMEAKRKAEADAEEKRQREADELAARNKELAEAMAQAEAAKFIEEAEERVAQARKRTRSIIFTVGAALTVLLIGVLVALRLSSK